MDEMEFRQPLREEDRAMNREEAGRQEIPSPAQQQIEAEQNASRSPAGATFTPPEAAGRTSAQLAGDNPNVDPASLQEILAEGIGQYVMVEFLIGTQLLVRREGILTNVGVSFLVLYEELSNTYMLCDLYSVKFATFFEEGERPADQPRQPQARMSAVSQTPAAPQVTVPASSNPRPYRR